MRRIFAAGVLALLAATPGPTANLPAHRTLRVLIVSDFVNPHSLSSADLVEPGDISAALRRPGSGLNLDPAADGVREIPTNSIEQATAALALPLSDPAHYDVLIYFAHRIPDNGNGAQARQDAFTAAVAGFLQAGGGVVVYHHGAYFSTGKEGILALLGGTASGAVPWNTTEGQNVIAVARAHFVTTNGLVYTGQTAYADPGRGVPAATYDYFNNRPDERYLVYDINPAAGEIEILFASNYVENGATHLLGFTHRRPGWCGRVVAYQPGEYEPDMLDTGGRNFQIIANEIVWAAQARTAAAVTLHAVRRPGTADVTLTWKGGDPCWSVWRGQDPRTVVAPANRVFRGDATRHSETPPAAQLWLYQVTSP